MASSSVQDMNEVVIVTLPETPGNDLHAEDKAVLVTADLTSQPGEAVLTVTQVATEAEAGRGDSMSKEEEVIVKLTEEVDVESDVFYPITCGEAKATLVWKKFVCPGINVKCVQFHEQLISPKEFVCLAGKSTLKDWKRAIRFNGTMLRKIMDSGELDFYQHTKVCSNTCRSTKIDVVGTKVSVSGDQSAELVPATPSSTDLNGALFPDVAEETSEWVTAIGEDTVAFWRGVKDAGLLEEVVEDFRKELQEVLNGLQERVCDPPLQVKDAVLLNNIVQNFGMLDLVKKVLASHKSQMDRYREQYTRSLAALEQQCDEHRKRAKELKSKSQHLNNVLMTLTPVLPPPAPKRPRMIRAISNPSSLTAAPSQITLPLNQLTGLPLGKLLSVAGAPASPSLGGYTLLTSPLPGSEVTADTPNLTVLSTAAGQEVTPSASGFTAPTAFVKIAGTQFQLVTLPTTLQSLAAAQNAPVTQTLSSVGGDTATGAEHFQEKVVNDSEGQPEGVREVNGEQLPEAQ